MRKLIIAATTIATLAVPAVSMAANNVATSRTNTPFTAHYVDPVTLAQTDCAGTHEVKVGKTAGASFVIDKEHCKLTNTATTASGKQGKPDKVFAPFQSLSEANFGDGWASDYNGAMSTSLIGSANATGTGFSIVATYPVGS